MKEIFRYFALKHWAYKMARKVIAYHCRYSNNYVTPEYLTQEGFVLGQNGYWSEPDVNGRDKIWIEFDEQIPNLYRVWHGPKGTFISLEKTREWFEMHLLLSHQDNQYKEIDE